MRKVKFLKVLAVLMVLIIGASGCGVKTKKNSGQDDSKQETVKLTLITMSAFEAEANVVRDQLKKIGIDVEVSLFSDYGSYATAANTGKYDMNIMTFSGSGSPDGQVRALYYTGGAANTYNLSDPELDRLIDEGSKQTEDQYVKTYTELENYLVKEKAYAIPLWNVQRVVGLNKEVDINSIDFGGPSPRWFRTTSFVDTKLNDTKEYTFAVSSGVPDTLDSLRGSSGTTYAINSNVNIRLLHSNAEGKLTTEGTLSRAYAICGDNDTFYFLLRDDINFGKVENMKAVDTGVRVGAEDVIYTYDRVRGIVSVPGNAGSEYLAAVEDVTIVTDINELKNATVSGESTNVLDYLNAKVDSKCTTLVEAKEAVDNSQGKYQVVKIKTKEAYPQLLINLGATQVGIVPKDVVYKVNEGITADNYDPNKNVIYGDVSVMRKGDSYNNNMWFSGPYVVTYIDDYGSYLERNPGFAAGGEEAAKIKNIAVKVIVDNATQTASLRNGELDEGTPTGNNVDICESDANVNIFRAPHISVGNLTFYRTGNSETLNDDLRLAILYAINQDELIAVTGNANKAHSLLTMIDTGWYPEQDLAKAKEHLDAYFASKNK